MIGKWNDSSATINSREKPRLASGRSSKTGKWGSKLVNVRSNEKLKEPINGLENDKDLSNETKSLMRLQNVDVASVIWKHIRE